ncbi:MAG: translation initiation factor IF-3 [Myxococcaceae bacterium]|nr:translation initiation factor IF-3 [Myxococcaceae bacterium]
MNRAQLEVRNIARDARTNRRIRAREVRVIGPGGEQLGVMPIDQALSYAQQQGLDLVEVSPMSKPPVCKVMDYGKFKYDEKKRANEARKKQVVVRIKEVKMRPKTEDHDYEFKVNNIRRFLEDGDKARVTIMFRGREITHKEIGQNLLSDVVGDLKDAAVIEQAPRMEGRQMFMILAPSPKLKAQIAAAAREREKEKEQAKAQKSQQAKDAPAADGKAEAANPS